MENSMYNGFGTFGGIILMAITAAIVFSATVPLAEAKVAHSAKASLKLLKTSASSSLVHPSQISHHRHRRLHKRETLDDSDDSDDNGPIEDDSYYDDNYDVIPLLTNEDSPKTVDEHFTEKAREFTESFAQMWQSVTESVKRCVATIKQLFSDDDEELPLTLEEQEARGKAIEEHNKIFRQAYENQIWYGN